MQNFNGTHKFEKEKKNFNEKSKTTCTIEKTCRHMILAKNLQIIKHYKTLLLLAMKDKTDLEPCRKKNHQNFTFNNEPQKNENLVSSLAWNF